MRDGRGYGESKINVARMSVRQSRSTWREGIDVTTKTIKRVLCVLATGGLALSIAGCGKSESSSGERDRNVSGGVATHAADKPAPYQAALYRFDPTKEYLPKSWWSLPQFWGFQCSAVIINKRWLATLNSCVSTFGAGPKPEIFHIGVGKLNPWAPTFDQNIGTLVYGVEMTYTGDAYRNFALVKTDRDIEFSDAVQPITLPFGMPDNWPTKGSNGQISGWGADDNGNELSPTLRWANVDVASERGDDACGDWGGYWSDYRICLTKSNTPTGGLACSRDQGGPFVVNVADEPMLAGIIADIDHFGNCASGAPTLAVRMREMLKWIASGPVGDFVATPDDESVTLSWTKPWTDWGPEPIDYVVEMSEDGKTWETINDGENTNTEVTFTGLTNGKKYSFRVAALNEVIIDNPEQRYYSDVARVTVGHQEPPATITNDGAVPNDPRLDDSMPSLPNKTEVANSDTVANPAAASASMPTTIPGTPTPTTVQPQVVANSAVVQLSTYTPVDVNSVVRVANVTVPSGARVSMTVDKSTKKICAVQGSTLVALKAGKCKVKVVVSAKGKKQSKSATIQVAK